MRRLAGWSIVCCAALSSGACTRAPEPASATASERPSAAGLLVGGLAFDEYKRDIETLSSFGSRRQGSESFEAAAQWVENRLAAAGFDVRHHQFTYRSPRLPQPRRNIYVTKVGTTSPDSMYILSAHLDGLGNGGAADDDGSGVALVLEAALAFAPERVRTDTSIRFVFWSNEETGLAGSRAYVADRAGLQGIEDPPGSGRFPEPAWLGVIQHDMLLFDHGLVSGPSQIDAADIDIEYSRSAAFAGEGRTLAERWLAGNAAFSSDYPAEVGNGMDGTDSVSFRDHAPAISIRENQRREIVAGSNPNWHQDSDVYATYSEQDLRLGFNSLQMSVGTVAELSGAVIVDTR